MYRFILPAVTFIALLNAVPVSAASNEERSAWSLDDILHEGSRLLTETITQGVAIIQDHLEVNATTTPSQGGEESTHLLLKVFPNGKGQPDDAMSLEGTIRRSPDPSHQHFGFDFHITQPKHESDPKDYI